MKYPFPVPDGLLNYQTCEQCNGKGCATCNGNGWHSVVESGQDIYFKKPVKVKKENGNKKVNDYEISEMVRLYKEEGIKQMEIGKMFSLSHTHVSFLINKWIREHYTED